MHCIDCPTATPDNRFTEGDPTIPVAATTVTADWLNAVQEELAAVIASAELTLDKENNAQLLQALHKILDLRAPLATLLRAGLMQPDGKTTTVDEDGLLSAMGGNLLLNSELWLTESGTFMAPVESWYELWMISGGEGGFIGSGKDVIVSGSSGAELRKLVYLEQGEEISVVIGSGGLGISNGATTSRSGGITSFGNFQTLDSPGVPFQQYIPPVSASQEFRLLGSGYGGGITGVEGLDGLDCSGRWYGAGGGAAVFMSGATQVGNGAQGAVFLRWHDPAKAAGPLTEPALFAARRMTASRAASAPATVNLYDPQTGQGSVWRAEDAEAKLAEGLISEEAWLAICAAKAAEERAEWLTSPDTLAERFALLRAAREAKLAATDYLVAPDYPITAEQKAAVMEYRQALRDLPAQEGAPWDGGGELTPWPEMPAVAKGQEA